MVLPGFRLLAPALVACCVLLPATSSANPVPINGLFKKADVFSAVLSPDGKSVAMRITVNNHISLAVMDIDSGKSKEIAEFNDADVSWVRWAGDKRLLYGISYLFDENTLWTGFVQDGLFVVNRDGSETKELSPTATKQIAHQLQVMHFADPIDIYDDKPDLLLASETSTRERGTKPIVFNMVTGAKRELGMAVTGEVNGFWTDNANVIRLAVTSTTDSRHQALWYRESENAAWHKITDLDNLRPEFWPLDFDADNKTLFVTKEDKNGRNAIYKYDFVKNAVGEQFFADADADIWGGLSFTSDTHRLLGIRYSGDQPTVHWFDGKRAAIQDGIDKVLPDRVNIVTGDDHSAGLLIHSYSDVDPGTYYYYDMTTHKLRKLFAARPWIKSEDLSTQSVFHYTARDGLDIPAYLTLPKGRPVKKLPLIVFVHGGPWARDKWGFDPEVQFLASRGYAVLQPEFRGSTGYGFELFSKGWKQWGQSMQDDITDGVQNLVKQGAVDDKRVCIMGASYGGYAAMMGVVKDPDLYRCAVNMAGVTDLKLQLKLSDWRYLPEEYRDYEGKELVGDPDKDGDMFDRVSPLKLVDRIKVPVFMAYGDKDQRVPMEEGEKMRDALKARGKTVEWMVLKGEGHGIWQDANNQRFYGALEAFLQRYNPAD